METPKFGNAFSRIRTHSKTSESILNSKDSRLLFGDLTNESPICGTVSFRNTSIQAYATPKQIRKSKVQPHQLTPEGEKILRAHATKLVQQNPLSEDRLSDLLPDGSPMEQLTDTSHLALSSPCRLLAPTPVNTPFESTPVSKIPLSASKPPKFRHSIYLGSTREIFLPKIQIATPVNLRNSKELTSSEMDPAKLHEAASTVSTLQDPMNCLRALKFDGIDNEIESDLKEAIIFSTPKRYENGRGSPNFESDDEYEYDGGDYQYIENEVDYEEDNDELCDDFENLKMSANVGPLKGFPSPCGKHHRFLE